MTGEKLGKVESPKDGIVIFSACYDPDSTTQHQKKDLAKSTG
jgi:hypothetical protein